MTNAKVKISHYGSHSPRNGKKFFSFYFIVFYINVRANLSFSCVQQTDLANVEARLWGVGSKSDLLYFCFSFAQFIQALELKQLSSREKNILFKAIFGNGCIFF